MAALPIDLEKIQWNGGGIPKFEVNGTRSQQDLRASDPTANIEVKQRLRLGQDLAHNQVVIILNVDIISTVGKPAKPADISGHFELLFSYTVQNLAELVEPLEGESEPLVHPQLAVLLAGVAYSTARGILWTRLAGTPLDGITLPILDSRKLLQQATDAPKSKRSRE